MFNSFLAVSVVVVARAIRRDVIPERDVFFCGLLFERAETVLLIDVRATVLRVCSVFKSFLSVFCPRFVVARDTVAFFELFGWRVDTT